MTGSAWIDAGIHLAAMMLVTLMGMAWCHLVAKVQSPGASLALALAPVLIGAYVLLVFIN